ncbi:4'-phosphopantetheinyl transferase superfamily protein [Streptacidiphilus sp. P02-A3a]|uniref:4'-phosphopantetheinyl transferase family protein n=1 Tax=Streptacidiphilus sp. P02-A3a TaxID=2704468 RepID=UPI0015FA757F|nr:4'-phosphopantetheinyl transferase superfamily protein [Streptacidiphilus sp. P02-A3a]QMU69452.1 4'-phosphopantetheinyl transferase superfamily protein [Streptacidiphilus sp. P02-A3a]
MTPAQDEVELWLIPTDQDRQLVDHLGGLLDPAERSRAAAADDPVRRDRFTVAHGVVRLLVAERLGLPAAGLRWRRGPNGKPEPVGAWSGPGGLRLNYSASGALAVLALAAGRRVGVDVEELPDPRVARRVADRFFPGGDARWVAEAGSPADRAARFAVLWCRREACVKVYGGRLAESLTLAVGDPGPVRLPVAGISCSVRDVPLPGHPGFRAAVAAQGTRPFRLSSTVWDGTRVLIDRQLSLATGG